MSNIAKIYNDLVSLPVDAETEQESLDVGAKELKWNWLNSTVTQEVFKSIIEDESKLIDYAIAEACKSAPNGTMLIQILVRVDTLRKLRKEFSNQQPQTK